MHAEQIVKKAIASGLDEAVATVYRYRRAYMKIANSKIDSLVKKYSEGAYLFVSSKKRVLFTNIDDLSELSIAKGIKNAKYLVEKEKPKDDYYGIADGPFKYMNKEPIYDNKLAHADDAALSDIAEKSLYNVLDSGASSVAGIVVVGSSSEEMATSKGVGVEGKATYMRLSLRAFFGTVSVQDTIASRSLSGINHKELSDRLATTALGINKFGRISAGIYDTIYAPSPAGLIFSNVNSMACMGSVETGSPFIGKLGKQVANNGLSIYDDGIRQDAVNSSLYDAEGVPSQRTLLIKNGVLQTYLHNYSTAVKYKTKSTGNAGLVEPTPNTAELEHKNNKKDLYALMQELGKGILITNIWYLRFSNDVTGSFSVVPRDLAIYIEHGEPKFAIKHIAGTEATGIRISDNIIRTLLNTEATGGKAVQSTSWDAEGYYYYMPYVLVRGVRFTVA
ncbi:MAG: TldD/PmbA family protein [Candidatus Micrarchaeaceae archaeon]